MEDANRLDYHLEALRVAGSTLLPERLPLEWVESARARFTELLREKAATEETNRGAQRYQMYLPWEPPFAESLCYAHEAVLALVHAVLGPDAALVYFASDTPLPGSAYQPVHSDTRLLFPESRLTVPAYGLVLNVPLVDCTVENGSLEFWPGTHLLPGPVAEMERLAAELPSRRANMPAGSLLVRDLRMWHRGTPNCSPMPRPHLALVYVRPWYRFELQAPLIPRAEWDRLPAEHRQLLRFAEVDG